MAVVRVIIIDIEHAVRCHMNTSARGALKLMSLRPTAFLTSLHHTAMIPTMRFAERARIPVNIVNTLL
jgi:hypothetical protein